MRSPDARCSGQRSQVDYFCWSVFVVMFFPGIFKITSIRSVLTWKAEDVEPAHGQFCWPICNMTWEKPFWNLWSTLSDWVLVPPKIRDDHYKACFGEFRHVPLMRWELPCSYERCWVWRLWRTWTGPQMLWILGPDVAEGSWSSPIWGSGDGCLSLRGEFSGDTGM